MKITVILSCGQCDKKMEKIGSGNDPKYVQYECPKCKIQISQELKVDTGLCNWEKK